MPHAALLLQSTALWNTVSRFLLRLLYSHLRFGSSRFFSHVQPMLALNVSPSVGPPSRASGGRSNCVPAALHGLALSTSPMVPDYKIRRAYLEVIPCHVGNYHVTPPQLACLSYDIFRRLALAWADLNHCTVDGQHDVTKFTCRIWRSCPTSSQTQHYGHGVSTCCMESRHLSRFEIWCPMLIQYINPRHQISACDSQASTVCPQVYKRPLGLSFAPGCIDSIHPTSRYCSPLPLHPTRMATLLGPRARDSEDEGGYSSALRLGPRKRPYVPWSLHPSRLLTTSTAKLPTHSSTTAATWDGRSTRCVTYRPCSRRGYFVWGNGPIKATIHTHLSESLTYILVVRRLRLGTHFVRQRREQEIFNALLRSVPGLDARLLGSESSADETEFIASLVGDVVCRRCPVS